MGQSTPKPPWKRPQALVMACIVLAYALVWPVGGYVIEDDWVFSLSLRHLHADGELRILDWIPMTVVVHLAWGLLFTKVLGFHLTLLKITTVVLLAAELWAVMSLVRHLGGGDGVATMAGLAVLFNPLHLFQSFLYATDIPALAWSSLALLFYARGIAAPASRAGLHACWIGSAFAALGWGVRQSAVLVVPAVLLYLVLFQRPRLRRASVWLSCFLLPTMSVAGFQAWYHGVHGPTSAYVQYMRGVHQGLGRLSLLGSAEMLYIVAIYAAFLLLPLVLSLRWSGRRRDGSPQTVLAAVVGLFVAGMFVWASFGRGVRFPYLRNKITQFGFLSPNEVLVGAREVLWGNAIGWAITTVLAGAAATLAFLIVRCSWDAMAGRDEPGDPDLHLPVLRLVVLLAGLQGAYVFVTFPILFDRHLLLLLPTGIVLLVGAARARFRPLIFTPCILVLALYGIAASHDLHALSRSAFRAGEELLEEGVDPRFIDAGFAFDGWHMFERSRRELAEGLPRLARGGGAVQDAWYLHNLIPRIVSKYVVATSPTMETESWAHALTPSARAAALGPRLDAYREVRRVSYHGYWPWGRRELRVLEDTTLPGSLGGRKVDGQEPGG